MKTQAAVEITHLRKTYGDVVAVDDLSLSVAEGEIFGILGPNGTGKTTTVECVLGLRSPDAGSIRVLGLDPGQDRADLHLVVGAQLQESALPAKLRVGEILEEYRSFYREPADVGELVDGLGRAEAGGAPGILKVIPRESPQRNQNNLNQSSLNAETQRARRNAEEKSAFIPLSLRSSANLCVSALILRSLRGYWSAAVQSHRRFSRRAPVQPAPNPNQDIAPHTTAQEWDNRRPNPPGG